MIGQERNERMSGTWKPSPRHPRRNGRIKYQNGEISRFCDISPFLELPLVTPALPTTPSRVHRPDTGTGSHSGGRAPPLPHLRSSPAAAAERGELVCARTRGHGDFVALFVPSVFPFAPNTCGAGRAAERGDRPGMPWLFCTWDALVVLYQGQQGSLTTNDYYRRGSQGHKRRSSQSTAKYKPSPSRLIATMPAYMAG